MEIKEEIAKAAVVLADAAVRLNCVENMFKYGATAPVSHKEYSEEEYKACALAYYEAMREYMIVSPDAALDVMGIHMSEEKKTELREELTLSAPDLAEALRKC